MLQKHIIKLRFILLFVAVISVIGCLAPVKEEAPREPIVLAFPPVPETPRFYYEFTLLHSGQMRVQDSESSWREILTGESSAAAGSEGLAKPYDVTTCGGRVYASDTVKRQVSVFDFNKRAFFVIGKDDPGLLRKPLGLDTDVHCNVYVADVTTSSIMVYDDEGNYIRAIGGADWFHRLSHVAVNSEGARLYAVDTGGVSTEEHRIRVFDIQTGEHLFDIGERGTEEGQFNLPKDIDVSTDGSVHVVDSGNFRVQTFDQDGNFIRAFGSVGHRMGQFARPKGIAVDPEGNIYVADTSLANIQIFNSEGQLLMFIGRRTNTSQPAGYMLPSGIDVDEDGRIYFVDQFFRKIDIFRPAGIPKETGAIGCQMFSGLEDCSDNLDDDKSGDKPDDGDKSDDNAKADSDKSGDDDKSGDKPDDGDKSDDNAKIKGS